MKVAHGVGDGQAVSSASAEVNRVGLCMRFVVQDAFACRAVVVIEDVEVDAVGAHGTSHLHDFNQRVGAGNGECFLIDLFGCCPPML